MNFNLDFKTLKITHTISRHNQNPGSNTFTLGLNEFSDLTIQEIRNSKLGLLSTTTTSTDKRNEHSDDLIYEPDMNFQHHQSSSKTILQTYSNSKRTVCTDPSYNTSCGVGCCPSNDNVCCNNGTACCVSGSSCCGEGCCPSGFACCAILNGCCSSSSICTDQGCITCPTNSSYCASSGECCPSGQICASTGCGGGESVLGKVDKVIYNWTAEGKVSPVKNQGSCGSCWSFSITGGVESAYAIAKNQSVVSLSEQNLIDCTTTPKYNNQGCYGGFLSTGMQYVVANKGIDTEVSYPYQEFNWDSSYPIGNPCVYNKSNIGATITKVVKVKATEQALTKAIATGPVTVAIDGSLETFAFYKSGVYNDINCSNSSANQDHAVLVVGYGTDNSAGNYYIVKNSWGTSWGNQGYFLLARNDNNKCGVALEPIYPLV